MISGTLLTLESAFVIACHAFIIKETIGTWTGMTSGRWNSFQTSEPMQSPCSTVDAMHDACFLPATHTGGQYQQDFPTGGASYHLAALP